MKSPRHLFGIAVLSALVGISSASAQTKYPKPPDQYSAAFRYRIQADRNERIRQFETMTKYLTSLGFKRDVTEDSDLDIFDQSAVRMTGTVPSSHAREILGDPRIFTVLLAPKDFKAPADEKDSVKVMIDLATGFVPDKQRLFSEQVKRVLESFGFREAVGYDHRGYTRLRGTYPWFRLPALLKDLRTQPSGWFLPATAEEDLPEPFKLVLPVRVIEVLSDEGAPAPIQVQQPLPPIPPDQPYIAKLTGSLRQLLLQEGKKDQKLRVELFLNYAPSPIDNSWREAIRQANPATAIDGLIGNVVTIEVAAGEQVANIARLPSVVSIRLPRSATAPIAPKLDEKKDEPKKEPAKEKVLNSRLLQTQAIAPFDVLKESRLDRLHARGMRGAGYRIAVIDTDFSGYEKFVGKGLPRTAYLVDLTAEQNSDVQPEPVAAVPGEIGHGTHCALAVHYAAPDAQIVLVRISGDAPYQLLEAYRFMLGDLSQPESFRTRREEIEIDAGTIRSERLNANAEYRKAFDDFDDGEAARKRRRAAKVAIAQVEEKEKALTARTNRLLHLEAALFTLKGVKVILNNVGWNAGQPLDGTSVLSRYLDEKMTVAKTNPVRNSAKIPKPTLWFQPAGDTRGQSWTGLFQDQDGNGMMDFAPPGGALPPGRWSQELNFLKFRTDGSPDMVDIPANTRVRISIQWREPHDPQVSELEYREPIAPLNLILLHQRDPSGEALATDEMEILSRTEGATERLVSEREFAVYEHTLEATIPADGRYAIRVDGKVPLGIRPGGALGIQDQAIRWELRPRIFIDVVDAATKAKGRVVFGDFQSFLGGVAVPADARTVVAVGAMRNNRRPQPYSAIGGGPQSELRIKPDVMTYDQLPPLGDGAGPARGSALSAAFATGMGTSLLSAGAQPAAFMQYLRIPPGHIFEVPENWIRR